MLETNPDKSAIRTWPLVIGIGASFRGDDEAGLVAAQALKNEMTDENVDFSMHSDDPARIIADWSGRDYVVVIDCVRTGAPAGAVQRIDLSDGSLVTGSRNSSHGNALADAVELSRALGSLPRQMIVLGIEGEQFGLGEEMSEACHEAMPRLIEVAREEITCMNRP